VQVRNLIAEYDRFLPNFAYQQQLTDSLVCRPFSQMSYGFFSFIKISPRHPILFPNSRQFISKHTNRILIDCFPDLSTILNRCPLKALPSNHHPRLLQPRTHTFANVQNFNTHKRRNVLRQKGEVYIPILLATTQLNGACKSDGRRGGGILYLSV
jgi:hypothetical protein